MPLYEYSCSCGYSGDIYAPIAEMYSQKCPDCNKTLKKEMSRPSLMLHGGLNDRIQLTREAEDVLAQKKVFDEKQYGGKASGEKDGMIFEWSPPKGLPARLEPNIK